MNRFLWKASHVVLWRKEGVDRPRGCLLLLLWSIIEEEEVEDGLVSDVRGVNLFLAVSFNDVLRSLCELQTLPLRGVVENDSSVEEEC